MAYTNPSQTAAYTQTTALSPETIGSAVVIANTDTYGANVYAMTLTDNTAAATINNVTVISGGRINANGTTLTDVTIGNGGILQANTKLTVVNLQASDAGAGFYLNTGYDGLTIAGGNTNIANFYNYNGSAKRMGANAKIENGVGTGFTLNDTYCYQGRRYSFGDGITLVDATINYSSDTDKKTSGTIDFLSGATMNGGSITKGVVNVADGAVMTGVTINGATATTVITIDGELRNASIKSGRVIVSGKVYDTNATSTSERLVLKAGAYAENVTGDRVIWETQTAGNITIAGANTNLAGIYYESTAGGSINYRFGSTAKIVSGEAQNFTINVNATVNFGDGITLNAPSISNGTTNLLDGAVIDGATVTNGTLNVSGGALMSGGTITGGAVNIWGGKVIGTTVTGTPTLMLRGTYAYAEDLNASQIFWNGTAITIAGENTNVDKIYHWNTTGYRFGADAKIENGIATGFTVGAAGPDNIYNFGSGITLKDATFQGGTNILSGAVVDGGTVIASSVNVSGGALMSGTTVTGGTVIAHSDAVVSAAEINGGEVIASGGLVSGGTVAANALVIRNGGEAREVGIQSGGLIHVSNGGVANGVKFVESGASMYLSNGAVANDVDVTKFFPTSAGYDIFVNRVCLGVGNGATVNTLNNSARLNVSGGGTINDLMLFGGAENVCSTTTQDITIIGGQTDGKLASLIASSGTVLSNFQFGAGAWFIASANTVVSGGSFDGSTFNVRGATVRGMTMGAGTMNVSAGLVEEYTVSGGTINVSNGTLTNATMSSGGAIIASGGKVENITLKGDKTTINIYNGGFVSNVTLIGDPETAQTVNNARIIMYGGTLSGATVMNNAFFSFSAGTADDLHVSDGGRLTFSTGVTVNRATLEGGSTTAAINVKGGVLNSITQLGGTLNITNLNDTIGTVNDAVISGGIVNVSGGGAVNNAVVSGGSFRVSATATATDVTVGEDGAATVAGTLNIKTSAWNVTVANGGVVNVDAEEVLVNANAVTGAHVNFTCNKNGANFLGSNTNVAEGALYYSFAGSGSKEDPLPLTALSGHIQNGVIRDLNANGADIRYKLSIGDGIVLAGGIMNHSQARISAFEGAVISGLTVSKGAVICADGNNVEIYDVTLSGTGTCNLNLSSGAYASNTTVGAGGKIQFQHTAAKADNTTIKAGGSMVMTSAGDTGDLVTLDFTGTTGNQTVYITDLAKVKAETEIVLKGETAGNTYTIANTGSTEKYVNCGDWGLYDDSIKANETITNAFTSMTYEFKENGRQIEVTAFEAAAQSEAGSIEGGTTINGNGKAAKWTANTTATGTIKAATSAIAGDAWLELDGANLAGTTLFGADNTFAGGAVNIYATGDATINNLAAGAEAGGTVAGVKLTVDDATVGLAYAGGFGNVTGKTETLIGTGATMTKDFYAGALANYAKTGLVTSGGDITLEIADGEFSGNIYGAASVKAGAATSLVHSVGNVTINVTGGETKKGNQACLFAGGYATGSTTNKVYTVGTIDTTISGGSWGAAAGGRGVFGGIFASNVTAEAGDVTVTISGGTFGNVYGGGWAQKGGNSIVGNVSISISGGTIANVFGGGTHSVTAPGGSTSAGTVTITVSGGNITGAIYARGQSNGDATGAASVIFTGSTNFGCDVYGYSRVGGDDEGATLSFTGYTGEFSGALGGFTGITLDGATAMTLGTAAADVSNGKWEFDFTDRADTLSATSFLTWSTADFAGDAIKVSFTDETQAKAGWNIATAAFTGATFDLYIGGDKIAEGIAYDTAIGGTGDWADWKFTDENGTLKFAQITA